MPGGTDVKNFHSLGIALIALAIYDLKRLHDHMVHFNLKAVRVL
jgi:hypothetical protein